jgi:hypothetical protein
MATTTRDERRFLNLISELEDMSNQALPAEQYKVFRNTNLHLLPLLSYAPGGSICQGDLQHDTLLDQIIEKQLKDTNLLMISRDGRTVYWKWTV